MRSASAMRDPITPPVSKVINLRNIITASPLPLSVAGERKAERFVITNVPQATFPFSVYKEKLRWNSFRWMWEHEGFFEPIFKSTYKEAMDNLEFRFRGIH